MIFCLFLLPILKTIPTVVPLLLRLKDRIQSQILTHYPKSLENALAITEQEAEVAEEQKEKITVSDLVKRLIEQVHLKQEQVNLLIKKAA